MFVEVMDHGQDDDMDEAGCLLIVLFISYVLLTIQRTLLGPLYVRVG
jgi:hypothetical protein